jgi:hypothetical protein
MPITPNNWTRAVEASMRIGGWTGM